MGNLTIKSAKNDWLEYPRAFQDMMNLMEARLMEMEIRHQNY